MLRLAGGALEHPILQGGMGVGVSLGGLAGAVAACGGMGCISTADAGYREPDFAADPAAANLRALRRELQKARALAGGRGLIAVNAMVATRQYADAVKTAAAAGADAIVSGAGLPLELPGLVPDPAVALAPVVSGGRAAALLCKTWQKRYGRLPDFIVVEGPLAGGHLGFAESELLAGRCAPLEQLVPEVLAAIAPFSAQRQIPVFAAGGVYTGADIARLVALGAAGVQLATRFIPTYECDADEGYKKVLLGAAEGDIRIVHSPVGMPGRALVTPLVQQLAAGRRFPPAHCARCIKSCDPAVTPYCITNALIRAVQGDREQGLFFCGANAGRLDRMYHVSELMDELLCEWRQQQ